MPTLAFIADLSTPTCSQLLGLLAELEGRASYVLGNDVATFTASPLLAEVDVIVPVVFAGGNPAVLAQLWPLCPKVRWVHSMAAGVDSLVPVLTSLPRGLETPLTNAKGAFSRSLAEYALTAMLHFNKQVPRLQHNRVAQNWEKFQMNQLHGQTVGFVGFGDIAQTTARLCRAFGMRVLALRQTRGADSGGLADQVFYADDSDKLEVFRQSDHVICSLPGGASTRHACGRAEFAVMRPSAVFISLGRGSSVDEEALLEVLQSHRIAGAALDVFDTEPLPLSSPLWHCEKLLLSPHNADLTADYMRLTWDLFLQKLAAFTAPDFAGFDGTVDKAKGY